MHAVQGHHGAPVAFCSVPNWASLAPGRVHHALGNVGQAASYLQQGLQTAEQLGRREEEARVRHRLGLVLWLQEDLDGAQHQLHRAQGLLEALGAEARGTPDRRDALGELLAGTSQALQVSCIGPPCGRARALLPGGSVFYRLGGWQETCSSL